MLTKTDYPLEAEVLRGREEIAKFLRVSVGFVDVMIDKKIIPVFNTRLVTLGHKKRGLIIASKKSLIRSLDKEAARQMRMELP